MNAIEQLIIVNELYPTDEALREKEDLLKSGKDIDLEFPIKPQASHFQLGKAYLMAQNLHQKDPKVFKEGFKTGEEWLKIIEMSATGREESAVIRYTLLNTPPCQYDIYPHYFTSIDIDFRRKDVNPDRNSLFHLHRYFSDIYGLILSCNMFYQDDEKYYNQSAKKTADIMKGLLDKYKKLDQFLMIERAADNTLVPPGAFDN